MKRLLFLATAMVVLLASSCKKKEETKNDPIPTPSANVFKVNGTSYTVSGSLASGYVVMYTAAGAGPLASFTLTFLSLDAPTSGTYKLVDANSSSSNDDEVILSAVTTSGTATTAYAYTGSSSVNITIAVNNGKISATIPQVTLENATSGGASATFSATVTQP